jgi:hypothetical protein
MFINFVVLVQISVLYKLLHLAHSCHPLFPQKDERVLKKVDNFESLEAAVLVDVVLLDDCVHSLLQLLVWDIGHPCKIIIIYNINHIIKRDRSGKEEGYKGVLAYELGGNFG